MKPAWDKLMEAMPDKVFDVDCTAAGKPLCDSNGVKGFPTIKWGDPANFQDYNGGRDFDALEKHAKENLGPSCSPANIDLCSDAEKAEIEKYQAMSDADLDKAIADGDKAIEDAEATFKKGLDELQSDHKKFEAAKEAALEEVKNSGLATLKSVQSVFGGMKCDSSTEADCSDKEKKFITTMKAKTKEDWEKQVARLTKMAGGDMKAELKTFLFQRLRILKQLLK
jgi:hypothetical protein